MGADAGSPAPPTGRAAIARWLREELGPPPRRDDWPPVSIVVLNRDGEDHLRLLLPRLAEATDYPRLELVLVDNGSRDGSVAYARSARLPFPLVVIENEDNVSYSDANDDGAEAAGHDLVLFLNNDIEPFEPGWLKELVAALQGAGAAAAGATLLYGDGGRRQGSDYILQHTGIRFARREGLVTPLNCGDGLGLEARPREDASVPAATAACLLVRRDGFELVGGFTTGYLWGWEDTDLGLKLAAAGESVTLSSRALLFHHESSTRARADREWQRRTRSHNRRLFAERWAPQVRREYMLDRIAGGGAWAEPGFPRLLVLLSGDEVFDQRARELADAVEAQGWRAGLLSPAENGWGELPVDADFALALDPAAGLSVPPGVGCVAWVQNGAEAWVESPLLRRAELTLSTDLGAARDLERTGTAAVLFPGADGSAVDWSSCASQLLGLLGERAQRLRFCLKLSRQWDLEPAALALRRSLEAREHACSIQFADEWESLDGLTADVALVLGDPGEYLPKPAQLNVLWTARPLRPTECDRWDLILVPEESMVELGVDTPTPVARFDFRSSADPADSLLELIAAFAERREGGVKVPGFA